MKGLGTDIISIQRVNEAIDNTNERLLERLFSSNEIHYCKKHKNFSEYFAGRFAAKEAVAKALGLGFGKHLKWLDFEILNNENGKPEVVFTEESFTKLGKPTLLISISHCKEYATATAIWIS